MKKSLPMFLAAVCALFAVPISCEQADDARFMIVGTWESTTLLPSGMPSRSPQGADGDTGESALSHSNPMLLTWTFNKNGTAKIRRDGSCIWKLSGSQLAISHDDGSVQHFTIMEITPTRLVLRGESLTGVGSSDYSFIKK